MKRMIFAGALGLAAFAAPAYAANADDLNCVESQFDDAQLAAMGAFFAELEEGEQPSRAVAEGKAASRSTMADAVDQCAALSPASNIQVGTAVEYLTQLSILRNIGMSNGAQWNAAMQKYAPAGLRFLADDAEPSAHIRAMIAAGAYANGVPRQADDESEESAIIAYLNAARSTDEALRAVAD
ncbi:MAG: hypothetical protein ABJX46_10920 [Erythrobacter sp.]